MAEVQYAPMSVDKLYAPRRINSEPNFDHLTFPPTKLENFEARISSAPSTVADSPRNSVTSMSTLSSCSSSYFDSASNQSSLDPYESEEVFSFPTYDEFNTSSDKPTFIHLNQSIEEEDPPPSPTTSPKAPAVSDMPVIAIDDIHVTAEPSRHVDYLSHDWKEEDIWASWRYMIGKRKVYDNAARLENASWRTWMKAKNKLKTVSPEKLNWMKDYDVTWLYGPLSTAPERTSFSLSPTSPGCSSAPKTKSLHSNTKKTILKKRSMSEVMLQRSISSSSLLKQATASIRSQQSQNHHRLSRPVMPSRAVSDYTTYPFASKAVTTGEGTSETTSTLESGLESPSSCRKHIHFNDRVEQCIAVEIKEEDEELDDVMDFDEEEEGSSDDEEGGLCLNMSSRPKNGSRQNSRGSLSEPQTIQKLPCTTLKAEVQPTELKQSTSTGNLSAYFFGGSSTPSTSSLGNGTAFVYNDDEEDDPIEWEPKWSNRRDSVAVNRGRFGDVDDEYGGFAECPPTPPSGNEGIFGRAVDAVNTARDIAHVFWNVGWASRR